MFAADPPAIVAPAEPDQDLIEVVATRPDQAQKIDRRIYRVKETSQSAQANTLQLLRGLPAVVITPDDQILLLGTPNVTVQIDGRENRTDLRNLHGSDIDRIEVITNPSAQYSAQGTGGIINIILRKKRDDGMSGTVSVEGSTKGRGETSDSLKVKDGKWTYELDTWLTAGRQSRSTYHKLRTTRQFEGGPETTNTEDGGGSYNSTGGALHGKVTYELDSKTSIIVDAYGGGSNDVSRNDRDFEGLTPDFDSFSERQRFESTAPFYAFVAALDHKGKKEGETLKASAQIFGNPEEHRRTTSEIDNRDSYTIDRRNRIMYAEAKADWEHTLSKSRILSMGAEWDYNEARRRYGFVSNGLSTSLGPDTVEESDGSRSILAAYATLQQPIGKWTFMPGLRVEHGSWHVSSPGRPSVSRSTTDLFPTLHVEHALTKTLQLTLSYSKRIDRADLYSLQPYQTIEDALTINQGNPDLRDQSTDAYEVNLHYSRKKLEIGLIVYDREIDGVWSNAYTVNIDGANVYMPINAGHQSNRGAQFDVAAPLFKRVKGTASVNLFNSRVPVDPSSGSDHDNIFRYTGNATIEWHGKDKDKRPGDIGQVQLTYESPSREFQFHDDGRYRLDFSYTHSFSKTLSVTANLNGLGSRQYRHELRAPLVQEDYERRESLPEFKLKLVKALGSAK